MARRTIVVDDIDGSEDAREVTFAIDGESWRIDLNPANRQRLRDALSEFIEKGSKTSGRGKSSGGSARTDLAKIRDWARANGHSVSDRGRVAASIVEAYEAATR